MPDQPKPHPDPLTLDPSSGRRADLQRLHDQLDEAERRDNTFREMHLDPWVRDVRAQDYLDRKDVQDQLNDIAAGNRGSILTGLLFVAALLGFGVWAAVLSRVVF